MRFSYFMDSVKRLNYIIRFPLPTKVVKKSKEGNWMEFRPIEIVNSIEKATNYTHSGVFHADEVMTTAIVYASMPASQYPTTNDIAHHYQASTTC